MPSNVPGAIAGAVSVVVVVVPPPPPRANAGPVIAPVARNAASAVYPILVLVMGDLSPLRRLARHRTLVPGPASVGRFRPPLAAGPSFNRPARAYQFVIDAVTMWRRSSGDGSRGATTRRRCCLSAPSTIAGTSSSV